MKEIKVKNESEIPKNFTGIIEFPNVYKMYLKEGKEHRENGPAVEWWDGHKEWYLESRRYFQLNLNDYAILDFYQGPHNLMWYKLLGKNKIFEYPDIPGLIVK